MRNARIKLGRHICGFCGVENLLSAGTRKKLLANQFGSDSAHCMIRAGFLDPEAREDLTELARDGSAAHRLGRRANALVLLNQGMSCGDVAKVLLLDDDTVRTWYRLPHQLLDFRRKAIEPGPRSIGWQARNTFVPGARLIMSPPSSRAAHATAPSRA
jgi:hypothetical protein